MDVGTPKASASTLYDTRSNFLQWDTWRSAANHVPYWNESYSEITSNSSAVQFTQNVNSQTGFAWNTQTVSLSRDFTMSANYYFGQRDGADGIVFMMRPLSTWPNGGTSGAFTGSWAHWSANEVRVYFDTYANGTEIAQDHIRISAVKNSTETGYSGNGVRFKNGSGTTIDDVENDQLYPITVKWTAASRTIEVFSGLSANYLITSAVIPENDLSLTEYNWGWMGFTGGANNYQYVTDVNYQVGPDVSTTSTDTTVVDGTSVTFNASYLSSEASPTTRWEYSTDGGSTWITTGVSTTSYTFTATRSMTQRKFRFFVSSTAAGSTFSRATVPVTLTVSPAPLRSDSDTSLLVSTGTYGILNMSGSEEVEPSASDAFTYQAWINPNSTCSTTRCTILSRERQMRLTLYRGNISFILWNSNNWGSWIDLPSGAIPINKWSHVAMTRDGTTVKIFLNGNLIHTATQTYAPFLNETTYAFYVGTIYGGSEYFSGAIDEVKIWKSDRSSNIKSDMNSNVNNASGLVGYWNFNEGTGSTAFNQVPTSTSNSDFALTAPTWDADLISTVSSLGPYTVRKFNRTYITSSGGWRTPANITRMSVLVVAGGGGGGSRHAGGGGAGGLAYGGSYPVTPLTSYSVVVGLGGVGYGQPGNNTYFDGSGNYATSKLGPAGGLGLPGSNSIFASRITNVDSITAVGGGIGSGNATTGGGGSGGGSNQGVAAGGSTQTSGVNWSGFGNSGGMGASGLCVSDWCGGGGGGAGSEGVAGNFNSTGRAGNGGDGRLIIIDSVNGSFFAAGGGGGSRNGAANGGLGGSGIGGNGGAAAVGTSGVDGTGSGGGGGGFDSSQNDYLGGNGGSGIVIVRWITALRPNYTKPVNAFLNVGMTANFSTNVAQDSATAVLTRTFHWESTTGGTNGTFSLIKQGTGAANASFSWVPTDTSTSGSNFLYRLIVTDSDTAGLFITDSSTAFAVINRTLAMTGTTRINKAINVSRNETFTVSFGTPVYNVTLSPVIPGITLDTSTITSPVIRIADTATVGTYYETLTVTDSVSASVVIPLTINIVPPPTLLNTGEIVSNDLVFHLEAGNSASLVGESGTATTGITWRDISGSKLTAVTGAGVNTGAGANSTCTAPTYTSANSGSLNFTSGSDNCYYTSGYTGRNLMTAYTAEAWFKTSATLPDNTAIITQATPFSNVPTYIYIGTLSSSGLIVGFYDNWATAWRFANCAYTPVIGAWTHIAGTYDGTTLTTYVNGISQCSVTAGNTSNTVNNQGLLIGKGASGATSTTFPGSIASVRIYKSALTAAQIQSNFNATRFRFDPSNNTAITPIKKYGDTLLETFTATSGSDTRTITFSVGDRSGIDWDTTTVASQIRLTLQESLTVGTFIDTVTVTDALGQSTYLPFRMTTSKADSLTVTMSAPTVITYNGSAITVYPRARVTGLKWTDTATAESRFSSALYIESTAAPTNADTYTVRGNTPTFTVGSIDNYLGVIYETSTATINKANQRPLNIFMYGGVVGSPYLIWLQGGDGTGAVTETLTGVSSLSGCAISNRYLTASEQKQGFCEVRVVKAGDQNYFAETQTVQLYFMAYINNQPTGQVGSGSTIALNGATYLETSTVQPPSITSLSTLTISLTGGGTLTITGTGFTGTVTVKFWRNKSIDKTSGNGTSISVSAAELSSIGATSGRVSVITAAGQAVSVDSLTITP